MLKVFGNRNICISRELTKLHEEQMYTNLKDAIEKIKIDGIKGEIVLLVEGANKEKIEEKERDLLKEKSNIELVKEEMKKGSSKKDAIKNVAKLKGISKNEVYQDCIEL